MVHRDGEKVTADRRSSGAGGGPLLVVQVVVFPSQLVSNAAIRERSHNQMDQQSTAVRTATAWSGRPANLPVPVEMLVTVSCAMLATLVFLGSGHRTSRRSSVLRFVAWLALTLCYPVVSYTIGLMQSGSFTNDLFIVWACFLIGCADGVFACSVDDRQGRTMLNQALQIIYVLLLLLSHTSSLEPQLRITLMLLWILSVAKLIWGRVSGSAGRERVLTVDNWLISKYMGHEYVRSIWDFDPDTMKGYKYVVTGEKDARDGCAGYTLDATDDIVTVDRVWQHEGRGSLLSKGNPISQELKDVCLSFALFKLLRRRLSGNPLHERGDARTLVFVRRGLAGGDSIEDCDRMYRVIEVELGFLFDSLYRRYPLPVLTLIPETAAFVAAVALSLSTLSTPALLSYRSSQAGNIWFTRGVIALFLILELFQYLSSLSLALLSDCHKVRMLCLYVRKPSWQGHPILERLLRLMFRSTLTTRYWSHSLGQYSLVQACWLQHERSCLARTPLLHRWIKGTRTVSHRNLPVEVKRAVHQLVRSEWLSNLKYGDRTLQRNDMLQELDWSTSRYQYGAVGSILIWHIATATCGASKLSRQPAADGGDRDSRATAEKRALATTLSDYCAYLLLQAPELVTDQVYEVGRLMEALQLRIQQFLKHKGCRSMNDLFARLPGFESRELGSAYEESILADGIKLGAQISNRVADEASRWKLLSEMWVELLLSVAPSDNVTAHVKKLATGGEFITHLWALLTHGGIIDRPAKPYYGSSAHQRIGCFVDEAMGASDKPNRD
ncbi:hypothetical protein ACP70R_019954 [Stipagrostis hirtigluma subsp. patula]